MPLPSDEGMKFLGKTLLKLGFLILVILIFGVWGCTALVMWG